MIGYIIKVVDLLFKRKFVSLADITNECSISNDRAYSCINLLKGSGMPISFDQSLKRFYIKSYDSKEKVDTLDIQDDTNFLTRIASTISDESRNGLRISFLNNSNRKKEVVIKEPTLSFKSQWLLSEKNGKYPGTIPVSQIQGIQAL